MENSSKFHPAENQKMPVVWVDRMRIIVMLAMRSQIGFPNPRHVCLLKIFDVMRRPLKILPIP
ncbi:uncharacterized protein Dwil_GK27170 [Drosophila willistoni]|uniref:Uncharacterized protein n=1 Tax=Drosophila willistoni TaxID=7260 RepID=A0A0Q9WR34_DROWI|nr:uncharacterized protein Dwil_GK27170 [Drosophila willistoni]